VFKKLVVLTLLALSSFAFAGSMDIAGNGSNGIPNDVIFEGTFTSPTWPVTTLADGTYNYVLCGALATNCQVGAKTQLSLNKSSADDLFGDDRNATLPLPEPSTLSLLGSGLIGLAEILHKRNPEHKAQLLRKPLG